MPETIGQRLRQAREERHFTLEKVAASTRIRLHYLQALEADDYSLIPSAAQARGFLRNYADFLGLDLSQALAEVQRARPQPVEEVSGPLPKVDLAADVLAAHQTPVEESSGTPALQTLRPFDDASTPSAARRLRASLRSARASILARFRRTAATPEAGSAVPQVEVEQKNTGSAPVESVEPQPVINEIEPAVSERHGANGAPEKTERHTRETEAAVEPLKEAETLQPEKTAKPRRKKKEPLVEEVRRAKPVVPVIEEVKAEAEILPEVNEQAEAPNESLSPETSPGLRSRFASLFRLQFNKKEESPDAFAMELESKTEARPVSSTVALIEEPGQIFVEIGERLRKRRELLSLTVDEIERHIKVRAAFVKALEDGAFDKLPSAVQTRGMLANYAALLDLDADALLLRFADAIQAGHRLRYPEKPGGNKSPMRVSPSMPPLRSFIAGDLIFGLSMAVLLIAMAIWGVNRVFSAQAVEQASLPTAPSISDVLATSQAPTVEQEVTLIPAADTPLPEGGILTPTTSLESPAFNATISVQVNILVVERTFLRVMVDGEEALNGRVLSGAAYTYEASESVEVLTGNAAALRITYNGRELGLMGNFGEVASRIYTAEGIITPTPAAPPTATPSLTPTPSQTPSTTPRNPSPTPGG